MFALPFEVEAMFSATLKAVVDVRVKRVGRLLTT
uniref:Uncharacterized protein n=1 Tax=Setaria italica TaxID=4555 RepID=K3Z1V1_SETIT